MGFAADFSAAYRPGIGIFENSRLFTRVHVGEGRSADRHLGDNLFANLNTIADNSEIYIEDDDAIAWLPELYLAHEFFDGRLTLVAGKTEALVFIDDNEFANNPYAQFVGKAFVNNPILDAENEFAPIAAATLSPVESFSVSALAVSSSRPGGIEGIRKSVYDKIFDKPMYAAQAAWSPKYQGLQGNYRVYFWNAPYSHVKSTGRGGSRRLGGGSEPGSAGYGASGAVRPGGLRQRRRLRCRLVLVGGSQPEGMDPFEGEGRTGRGRGGDPGLR